MSGSTARKVQPFTIGTKLSLPKGSPDFPGDGSITALDNCVMRQNLNEHVSLYLAQASPGPAGRRFDSTSPVEEMVTDEDRVNLNSLSRSIKKITLSDWHRESGSSQERMPGSSAHTKCERNCNNNNCRSGKAQFKVFLRKEAEVEGKKQDTRRSQAGDRHSSGDRVVPLHMITGCAATAPWKESVKNTEAGVIGLKSCMQNSPGLANLSKWSHLIAQFNCDVVQAEKWVNAKLQDLKDGCSIQEWERGTQALQRDMKDFENTMIKLNQMGEQIMVQSNPSAEMVRRQLQTLQEQWQLLKHMAANQSKAVGGLRNLQEFNQKAEQLEAWIRQKEEKPLLAALLQENADKIQLTRRILDLKQEEQQFQVLHEEMNSLAQKLEKQGKSESRSIMARRKHLNKMWLRLQGTLKEHHETLQLALEAAAFLQQADVLLGAIHTKWKDLCGMGKQREPESSLDLDVRDIASQIMMLDVTVSQLTSLHPSLVARVSLKHQEVKENWAQLQQLLRSEKPHSSTRRSVDSLNPELAKIAATNHSRRFADEKPGKSSRWGVQKDIIGSMTESGRDHEGSPGSPRREITPGDNKRRRKFLRQSNTLKDPSQQETHLQEFSQVIDGDLQQLLHTGHRWSPQIEDAVEELEDLWAELKRRHQENGAALREIDTALQLVGELEEAECWLGTVTDLLSEPTAMNLDDLHEDIQKISSLENQVVARRIKLQALQDKVQMDPSSEHTAAAMIQRKMERVKKKLSCVHEALQRRALDLQDSLVLTEFLQNMQLEEMLNERNHKEVVANQLGSKESLHLFINQNSQQLSTEDMSKPLEELQEAVEMLNNVVKEREWAMEVASKKESLEYCRQDMKDRKETRLAWITSQVEIMRGRTETLAQDITEAERSFTSVKSELDLLELHGLLKRQQDIESDMSAMEGNMLEMKRKVSQLVDVCDESRRVQETLAAWKELQKLVQNNAVRAQQAVCLQRFFRDYLAIISWTEDTRAQIFSESPSVHGLSETQWEELGSNIETKFKEFEALAAAGGELVSKKHHLSEMIKERLEELQGMLDWVMVRWQAQSSQKDPSSKSDSWKSKDGTQTKHQNCPSTVVPEVSVLETDAGIPLSHHSPQEDSTIHYHGQENESRPSAILGVLPENEEKLEEVESGRSFDTDIPKETLVLQPSETPLLLVPQPGPNSLGSTVNLILSIGKKGEREAPGSQAEASQPRGEETLHKLSENKSSAYRTFWKRCQGLLGNTLSSLKRKKRLPHRHVEEVSTYLHVKEKDGGGGRAPMSSTIPLPARQAPARANSAPLPCIQWGTSAFHTLPKISSSFSIQSLKRRSKAKTENAQLLTLQGIMETESTDQQPMQEEKHTISSTWPPKCHRRALALQGLHSPHTELMDYVKNPLARAIDAECDSTRETSGWRMYLRQNRITENPQTPKDNINTYHRLSLGSVLSLELPKDPTVLRNIQDVVKVGEDCKSCRVAQGKTAAAKAQETVIALQKRALEGQPTVCQRPIRPRGAAQRFPKSEGGTWFEEVNINPSYSRQKPSYVAAYEEDGSSPKSQSDSSDDFLHFGQNRLSRTSLLHEQIGWEWDKLAATLTGAKKSADHKVRETSKVKLKPSPAKPTINANAASSTIHIKGPATNETPKKDCAQGELECSEESFVRTPSSLLPLGSKSPTKLSVFECEVGHQEDIPASTRLGSLVLAPEGGPKLPDMGEVCHPAHELFEEEEEELQAIWNNVEKHKRIVGVHDEPARKVNKAQTPESSGGQLILSSADNVLVAKFKLPTSAQLLQGSEGAKGTSDWLGRKSSPSRCWASLPSCQEPSEGTEAAPIGSMQGTCLMNQQKVQEEGRVLSKVLPSKLELQMMEGTLERKHLLQAGGKKANCRSWNMFHTVLMRQTLCFYQDKKDTLKSSMVALPLNLSGAVCSLETEYTKKTNCFTLQLKDGAKYLLRAPTESLMKEWIAKLQQNSGLPEMDYFQSASQNAQGTTSAISLITGHGTSHFLGLHQPLSPKSQEAVLLPGSGIRMQLPRDSQNGSLTSVTSQAGNGHSPAANYTSEHSLRQCSLTKSPSSQDPYTSQEEDCGLVSNKRRSYSFTSATYQKILPLSVSKEALGAGSSYSVTLYIGEQAPATPRPRCHSFMAIPRETFGERSQGASPRQKSKSVFRKFFGKKD